VIIPRLPFRVPTEPLQEARSEEIRARGGNDFLAFTVPQAVLRFKQGFGRLIRSQEDRGVVAILDRRILTKRYGKLFLESLPRTMFLHAPAARVVAAAREFFAGGPAPAAFEAPETPVDSASPWDEAAGDQPAGSPSPLPDRRSGSRGPPW
jgi:ATP-dependent DNA helicase DinG